MERKKILCLFANEFPYGGWEAYLETEIGYYRAFDLVYVFSLQLRHEHAETIRPLPDNFRVFPVYYASDLTYIMNAFRALFDRNLYRELFALLKTKRFSVRTVTELFVYLSRAHYETRILLRSVGKADFENADALFYSYRFEYQPYVALLMRKKLRLDCEIVARAHRYDLYENVKKSGYIPCRPVLLKELARVYPCSEDGARYLAGKYPAYKEKISPRFLGTRDRGVGPAPAHSGTYQLVSCSHAVPVKRLDLIVSALSLLPKDVRVHWTHYGDGPVLPEIKAEAARLPENISVSFPGNVPNAELMKIYAKTPYDLFLNVSSSEGIPVSIMEVNSFGIPCIATDVGGTREMVSEENGCLLPADCTAEQIAAAIRNLLSLPSEEYNALRARTRKRWQEKFDSATNYRAFISELVSMLK